MQRCSVRVHRYDSHEVFDPQMPDRFGRSEVEPIDGVDALDRCGADLRGAADRMQIDSSIFFACGERLLAHSPFPDHSANFVTRMTSCSYGSSRDDVVGPAALQI